jgi:23S rRNA (uridine2479-2'-O)-methyltransferase
MRWTDVFRVGAHGLRARPMRVALSAVGIAIGIAAMVAVVGISASSGEELKRRLDALGTNLLTAGPGTSMFGNEVQLPLAAESMVDRIAPVESSAATGAVDANVYRNDRISSARTAGLSVLAARENLLDVVGAELADRAWLDPAAAALPPRRVGGGGAPPPRGGPRPPPAPPTTPPPPAPARAPDLLAELSEKSDGAVEVLAVVAMRPDELDRIPVGHDFLGVAFDRPTQPGNIGSIIRSADAFGAHGVITTGHAADAYDPKSVRASTGSFFATPVVRAASPRDVAAWVDARRADGVPVVVVAPDEHGAAAVSEFDLTQPVLLLIGNETAGLSSTWRELADVTVSIPMAGSASSLNAANAASVVLYEAHRQRSRPRAP